MGAPKLRHFWEGKDTAGRELRAFFVQSNATGFTYTVPSHMQLPVVVFRRRQDWKRDTKSEGFARAVVWRQELNESRLRRAAERGTLGSFRRLPAPRGAGTVWTVAAYVPLVALHRCASMRTQLGVEQKFRPGMARLTNEQLSVLLIALDAWLESAGDRSLARELRSDAVGEAAHG